MCPPSEYYFMDQSIALLCTSTRELAITIKSQILVFVIVTLVRVIFFHKKTRWRSGLLMGREAALCRLL